MAYSASTDLNNLLPEIELINLTDDDNLGVIVESVVVNAILQADEEIDSYISCFTSVPLDPVPQMISHLSGRIAVYNLYRRRLLLNETWSEDYKNCKKILNSLASGKLKINLPAGGDARYKFKAV